jgi:short-chain fatty acids transporter
MAVTYASSSIWQFGFSASAPLLVATSGHFLESSIGVIPLRATIWAPATIVHVTAFTLAVIVAGCRLMPRNAAAISQFPDTDKLAEAGHGPATPAKTYSERLERRQAVALLLCLVLAGWLYQHFIVNRRSLDINSLNTVLLLLTLLMHRNFKMFTGAIERAVSSSWPVVILYHLYAGLAGLIQFTPIGERMAALAATVSTEYTFPALTAIAGTLVSTFVPSSGGQWAIQGFVTSKAAQAAGVSVERGLLALGIGDQMGNLMTPFWYVIAAGIARVDFRKFFGYGIIFAALWFVIGVVAFTFFPC